MSATGLSLGSTQDSRRVCDNAGRTAGDLGVPGCWDNEATRRVTTTYDEHGIESDTVYVCAECAERVAKEMRQHGYDVEIVELVR